MSFSLFSHLDYCDAPIVLQVCNRHTIECSVTMMQRIDVLMTCQMVAISGAITRNSQLLALENDLLSRDATLNVCSHGSDVTELN